MKNRKNLLIVIPIIIGILIIGLFSSVTTIKSGEVGIRVRFGKVVNKSTHEGINFKIPVVERIEKMNVKVQKVEVQTESSSKDLQQVNMSVAVNYRIDYTQAIDLYKNVGTGYVNVVLAPAIEESIKSVTSKYTAEELITHRSEVSEKCMEELSKKVSKYGLLVSDFNITDFGFSKEFDKAIEEKQIAEQKVLTAKQELERERIEAEKKIVAAEAEKKANELKQKTLTDNIIKEKFIEKWDGQLPKVSGSNNIMDVSGMIE
jgi:regulator of protease activity HflC (stomatin/prohibitin superfamily)